MKLNRILIGVLVIASLGASAGAQQTTVRQRQHTTMTAANPQALAALQKDLIAAIQAMTSALPIYDGNRVHSIHAAHQALMIVDRAISGKNAVVRTKPQVNDKVGSKGAHAKYTAQQISQSQGNMQTGLNALNQAVKDLQTAAGSAPNKQATNVSTHLNTAISECNKAIALHSGA